MITLAISATLFILLIVLIGGLASTPDIKSPGDGAIHMMALIIVVACMVAQVVLLLKINGDH